MKRIVYIAAIAAMALYACQKTEQAAPEEPDVPGQEEQVQEPVGGDIAVFTASVDGSVTKTCLEDDTEGKKVVWTAGDQINVNGTVLTLETENQPDGYGPGCTKGNFAGNKPFTYGHRKRIHGKADRQKKKFKQPHCFLLKMDRAGRGQWSIRLP